MFPPDYGDHITNKSQFMRQTGNISEPSLGSEVSPSTGNQSWHHGTTQDIYQHVIGERTAEQYDFDTYETKTTSKPLSNATLMVKHHGATGNTEYRPEDDSRAMDFDYRMRALNPDEVPGQLAMFHHRSSQPSSEVSYMMGTRGGRVANMTQLGMAARDTMLTHGRELKPSDDLSSHSENLVNRLEERGVTTNRKAVSNRLDFEAKPYPVSPEYGYSGEGGTLQQGQFAAVPEAESKAGKGFLKGILGATRNKTPNEEQLRLFR